VKSGMGVIVKRPIANAAWRSGTLKPTDSYHQTYWERLQQLNYAFLEETASDAAETALRFTLSFPGVSTAIVGTTNPDRWVQNALLVNKGLLIG